MKNQPNNLDVELLLDDVNQEYEWKDSQAFYHAEIRPAIGALGVSFALFIIGILLMMRFGPFNAEAWGALLK